MPPSVQIKGSANLIIPYRHHALLALLLLKLIDKIKLDDPLVMLSLTAMPTLQLGINIWQCYTSYCDFGEFARLFPGAETVAVFDP